MNFQCGCFNLSLYITYQFPQIVFMYIYNHITYYIPISKNNILYSVFINLRNTEFLDRIILEQINFFLQAGGI